MPTTEALLYQWPKPSEHNTLDTMIRTLNLWKPAGEIVLHMDGGGSAIAAGGLLYLPMPMFKCIIMGWTMIGDTAGGSLVVDIWRSSYPTIPTVADTITAAAKPTLTAQQINRAVSVPTWSILCAEDDILAFKIDSASGHTRATLSVAVARGDLR